MKLSKIIGCLFIVAIISSLGIGTTKGLTPSQYFGMSAGDVLYYRVTDNRTGTAVIIDSKVVVTSVWNGTFNFVGYNFVNATTYTYYLEWGMSFPDTIWVGYNQTYFAWYGGLAVLLGFPTPAPKGSSMTFINTSLYFYLTFSNWGTAVTSQINSNVLTLENATESIILTYNTTTGICLENKRMRGDNLYNKQVYLGEVDPYATTTGTGTESETTTSGIAGYTPLTLALVIGITSIIISKRVKSRRT